MDVCRLRVTDMMRAALATRSVVAKGTMSASVRLARRNVDHASLTRCRFIVAKDTV